MVTAHISVQMSYNDHSLPFEEPIELHCFSQTLYLYWLELFISLELMFCKKDIKAINVSYHQSFTGSDINIESPECKTQGGIKKFQ